MASQLQHVNNVTNNLGLAAAALLGVAYRTEFSDDDKDSIMQALDDLFSWTVRESDMARDHMFWDDGQEVKDSAIALARKLIKLAVTFNGTDEQMSMIFMAGFQVFDMCESLFEHCHELARCHELLPDGSFGEREMQDAVFENSNASLRYWDRV